MRLSFSYILMRDKSLFSGPLLPRLFRQARSLNCLPVDQNTKTNFFRYSRWFDAMPFTEKRRTWLQKEKSKVVWVWKWNVLPLLRSPFRNIPFVQFLFGADNLDCQEYDMRDLILYGRNAGNKYLSLAFECGIRLWITAHMPGLCLYDEISSKQKESNGFSVALFLYLYATKPATPLTKIYSVFAVFKPCRRWWRWSDSNWLPIRCERIALPGELHPRD